MREKIVNGEYTIFPESLPGLKFSTERINFESRHVKFEEFIEDYLSLTSCLPADKDRTRLKELTVMMLDKSYSMNTIPYRADNDLSENSDPTKPTHRERYNNALEEYNSDKKDMVDTIRKIIVNREKKNPNSDRAASNMMKSLKSFEDAINKRIESLQPKHSKALLCFDEGLSKDAIKDIIEDSKGKTATSDLEGIVSDMERTENDKDKKSVEENQK